MEEKENAFELVESRDALNLVPTWEFQAWWLVAAGAALIVFGLILIFLKRSGTAVDPTVGKREAYLAAKSELEALEDRGSRERRNRGLAGTARLSGEVA